MTTPNRTPAQVDKGTPETREHYKHRGPGTIEALLNRGKIGGDELRAADEFVSCYVYTTSPLVPRTMRYEPRGDRGYSENDPRWYRDAYIRRYKPWANQNRDYFTILQTVLIQGHSLRWLDSMCRCTNGSTSAFFIEALRDYAIFAGWVCANTMDDWRRERAA